MKDNKYSIKGDLSVGSRNTAMKDFSVGGGVGERLYMYYPNTQYKYAVESNYIIGFGSREGTLYFKSEKEAKNYVKEKPTLRKYLGEKFDDGGGVGGFDAETIKQKKSEMYIAQNTNTGQVYVGGIKSKNKLYKDEKGYYLIDGYGTFMGKKYPVKKYFTPLENAVLSDYMQERYADGGSLDEEWVVYDCDTDRVLSKHKNHRSAKQASNKYWNSGKYGCIGIERKSEWDLYHLQFETGGMTDEDYEGEDLFEHYDKLPMEVQNVLEKYSEVEEYDELNRMQMELEKLGYTFDWGLDAVPFNLRKMEMGGVADKYIRSSSYKKEMQVFHSLYESRISTQRLTQILGHEPEYPIQRVGKLTLRKVYLDSYYQLVN